MTTSSESCYRGPHQVPCSSCGTLIDERYNLCPRCRQHTAGPCPAQPGQRDGSTSSSPLQGSPLEYQSCRKQHTSGKILIMLSALFLLVIAAGVCISTPPSGSASSLTVDQIKSTAMIATYDDLLRYNEQYIGKYVKIRGKIIQSQSSGTDYVFHVATGSGRYDEDILYLNYNGPRFTDGDLIDIWGRVDGLKTDPTVLGDSVIPKITSSHLELVPYAAQTVLS
ncbi:hypothetical protein [Methanosphaerula subterraneus]|uniref:hypothetical protein n=1 Tax=Methanosphaerula subterraneus TaxID=3350244 RepID=UPI003F83C728